MPLLRPNALTGKVGPGTQVSGNPLAARTLFAQSRQSAFRIGAATNCAEKPTAHRSQLDVRLAFRLRRASGMRARARRLA